MNQDFLFELGCEELPAGQLAPMAEHLQVSVSKALDAAKLQYSDIQTFYTPRRLALSIKALQTETKAQIIERRGPAKNAPSQALEGFLKSCNATHADLIEVETDKGTWFAVKINQAAVSAKVVLVEALTNAMKTMPLKKTMRWGNHDFAFLRPVHWIVALLGEEIVPLELFGLKAGRESQGHRFMKPAVIPAQAGIQTSGNLDPRIKSEDDNWILINHPAEYQEALRKAYVMVDRNERKATILAAIKSHPARLGKLEEVLDLVEWPVPLLCSFEKEFLSVPTEALITTMEVNQRVFPVLNDHRFWTVANIESKKPEEVIHGNEKVVRARLSDAKFFYDEDLKTPLECHLEGLKKITFQQGLGSLFDKVLRLERLVEGTDAKRAAHLCKADLITQMVQEFPELQGYMGHQYALKQGEKADVAIAIEDHYKPKGRGGELPRNEIGAHLALADKIDTLVGLFSIGKEPTSSGDPFALRRQALGVIAILVQRKMNLNLLGIFQKLNDKKEVLEKLHRFFEERMEVWCREEKNLPVNVVRAVLAADHVVGCNPYAIFERIEALTALLQTAEGEALKELAKRMGNIIEGKPGIVDTKLFTDVETKLWQAHLQAEKENWGALPVADQYRKFLTFKQPIADFFDAVMVNDPDPKLKANRQALLFEIHRELKKLADFNKF